MTSSSVTTEGIFSFGIFGISQSSVTSRSQLTATLGDSADGIAVYGAGGSVVVSETVETGGSSAEGIRAHSYLGDVSVTSGSIVTAGANSDGIVASANQGDINITSGSIITTGFDADGISARPYSGFGVGSVTIDSGSIVTSGEAASADRRDRRHGNHRERQRQHDRLGRPGYFRVCKWIGFRHKRLD